MRSPSLLPLICLTMSVIPKPVVAYISSNECDPQACCRLYLWQWLRSPSLLPFISRAMSAMPKPVAAFISENECDTPSLLPLISLSKVVAKRGIEPILRGCMSLTSQSNESWNMRVVGRGGKPGDWKFSKTSFLILLFWANLGRNLRQSIAGSEEHGELFAHACNPTEITNCSHQKQPTAINAQYKQSVETAS